MNEHIHLLAQIRSTGMSVTLDDGPVAEPIVRDNGLAVGLRFDVGICPRDLACVLAESVWNLGLAEIRDDVRRGAAWLEDPAEREAGLIAIWRRVAAALPVLPWPGEAEAGRVLRTAIEVPLGGEQ